MKRTLSALLVVALLFGILVFPNTASARPMAYNVVVSINGQMITPSDSSMVPYINHDGRTMISVRSVMDALSPLGCSVSWNDASKGATIECNNHTVEFYFNSPRPGQPLEGYPVAYVDGRAHRLLTTPEINRDRSFLGLRDLGNLLEVAVSWAALDDDLWVAGIDTTTMAESPEAEYEVSASYMEQFTYAVARNGRLLYEVNIPSGHVFPVNVAPHHVSQFIRNIEETNSAILLYNMWAYADPPDDGTRIVSQPVVTKLDQASPQTLAVQRSLALAQLQQTGKVRASEVSTVLRTYYSEDGTRIEIIPGGELHYLNRTKSLDFATKRSVRATVSGVAGTAAFALAAQAWPVGTAIAGLALFTYGAYNTWLYIRVKDYCLPASDNKGIVLKLRHVRFPDGTAQRINNWVQNTFNWNPSVESYLYIMPTACMPWTGI